MIEKILFVSDGIIAVTGNRVELTESCEDIALSVSEFGAVLTICGFQVSLPVTVLDHLEQAEGTNIHFYESETYRLVATYQGCVTLHRDTVVKAKGAWEFVSSLPIDDGNISGNG